VLYFVDGFDFLVVSSGGQQLPILGKYAEWFKQARIQYVSILLVEGLGFMFTVRPI
jgi:hypothetical protein